MNSNSSNSILQNLFDFGLEEILQKIFLNLDPKSLKNAKLTCTTWKEFIDRRIWNSRTARGLLHSELIFRWKNEVEEPMKVCERDVSGYGMYITFVVCDLQVILCSLRSGKVLAFDANACEFLYSLDLSSSLTTGGVQMDVSKKHAMIVCENSGLVLILDKITGKVLFRDFSHNEHFSRGLHQSSSVLGLKMLKNVGVAGTQSGKICFIRNLNNNDENSIWETQTVDSGISDITHIEGDEQMLVIGSRSGAYLWDTKEMQIVPSETSVNVKVWMLSFHYPFVFVIGGNDWNGMKMFDIVKGKLERHIQNDIPFHNIHSNGRFILLSEMMNHRTPINVAIYDQNELLVPGLRDDDLWCRIYAYTSAGYSFSSVIAVSNMTKYIVTNRNTLTVYDFWKD